MSEGASDRLRRLIDRLPAMLAYWDSDLCNVVANEAHVRYFGLTPDEIQGRNIFDLLGEDLGERSRPYIEAAMAGQEQVFEKTLTDSDGVTRHVQANYLPDLVDGQVRGLYVQVADVAAPTSSSANCRTSPPAATPRPPWPGWRSPTR